jgi:outer membrane lipoprotein SlyB
MKKRLIATLMMFAMLAVMIPFSASSASAQTTRYYNNRNYSQRTYNQGTYNQRVYKKPSTYNKHRNLINVGVGAGAGAILGALFGGKKGAAIGALVGGGGAAVYSYGIKPKKKTYYRPRY